METYILRFEVLALHILQVGYRSDKLQAFLFTTKDANIIAASDIGPVAFVPDVKQLVLTLRKLWRNRPLFSSRPIIITLAPLLYPFISAQQRCPTGIKHTFKLITDGIFVFFVFIFILLIGFPHLNILHVGTQHVTSFVRLKKSK